MFTKHAEQRMQEMNVSREEVESVVAHPITSHLATHYEDRIIYVGRRIQVCVAFKQSPEAVITVLWTDRDALMFLQPNRRTQTHTS